MRCVRALLHGKLSYPVGTGRLALGTELLPLFPSNDIFYDPPKLRYRLDQDGYLYFKNTVPRDVVNAALDDLATQMRECGLTLDEDRARQAELHGFAMGVPYPSTSGGELPPPNIHHTDTIRNAVSGTSVMATVRQVFGGAVQATALQTLHLGAPGESFGFRMPSVFLNRGTKLALVAIVPLHDTPLHMGTPLLVRSSNSHDTYAQLRKTYGQWEVEGDSIRGDGCYTENPAELSPFGKLPGTDDTTGASIIVDVNPFVSSALEAGDVLLTTVYTMQSFLTNQTNCWRLMAEAVWCMDGDDVGLDPRYMGSAAPGLAAWTERRDDPTVYPKSLMEAKKEWGLVPDLAAVTMDESKTSST
ncbi:protein of unknown function - conserved [Leishmania donovani]|uniref:Hypothetical_protein_conserved n=1 Tax=Leishmania donovani TaxID=5661 RepID=A0A3S7WWQ0_LEIDO|nr:hypothetical protein, conserved [Leishmania donovani]AYU78618.1 hypothetical protein LdCL_210021100 [Leishmania donovani]TPP49375.1 hypothetical protein CGC21_34415 [Leishmania donovani]TPP54640.1 hypothetical protein CGC20_22165 [Leishmania donovani]CAJ1988627.1 protein of unknown function - conserved [Leishmania donovani]CBZ33968.1 hypothetical protein, conserved [Leishmania donovani]